MASSWITGVAIGVTLGALLPLFFIGWAAVQAGWSTVIALVLRPRVAELLENTLWLVGLTLPLSIALSVMLAWLTERSNLPGARLWAWIAVTPLAIPAFVHSYAWVSLIPALHGLTAAVLLGVLAYSPFLYLPIAATLRRLDPSLEDVASSLGHTPLQVFFRIVLPQLRLAILGGSLLVGLHLLSEFGLFAMVRFDTFTTAIMDQFQSAYSGAAANMLAGVLVVCCFTMLGLEALLRGRERYARVGSGAARVAARRELGALTIPALAIFSIVTAMSLGVPIYTLGRWSMIGGFDVWRLADIGAALGETLLLATIGAMLTTLAALPMAWLSIRAPGRLQRALEACNYFVGSLPGIVVALALVTITVRVALPIYQTIVTLLLAYMILFLPRALVSLRSSIAQAPVELEQAANSLGRTPGQALWQVTVRLAAPGAAAGMALVALGIVNELTATQLLAPNGTQTLATAFWAHTSEIDYAAATPYALIMVLISLPLTLLLHFQSKRTSGR